MFPVFSVLKTFDAIQHFCFCCLPSLSFLPVSQQSWSPLMMLTGPPSPYFLLSPSSGLYFGVQYFISPELCSFIGLLTLSYLTIHSTKTKVVFHRAPALSGTVLESGVTGDHTDAGLPFSGANGLVAQQFLCGERTAATRATLDPLLPFR